MFATAVVEEEEGRVSALEAELAEVCGVLNAATGRLVDLIGAVLACGAWEGAGIRSPEHWVAWRCGVSAARARTLVAMARRLPDLPDTHAALCAGELSADQVAVVCRHAPDHNDAEIAAFAREATVTQLHRTLAGYTFPAADREPVAEAPARVTFGFTDSGRFRLSADLPADHGALLERALHARRDALFKAGDESVSWADALVALAERSLDHDAAGRGHSDRHLVLVHIATDQAWLHPATSLPAPLRRYLTCDAQTRPVWERDGRPVNVGRRRRTVPEHTRIVIENRDRGCRVPGCPNHRWLHIHHIRHWEDGGTTDTHNLVALCAHHHRLHHHGQLGITGSADENLRFTDAHGRAMPTGAIPQPPGDPPAIAARRLRLTTDRWTHPSGEPLHTRWIDFSEPAAGSERAAHDTTPELGGGTGEPTRHVRGDGP